MAGDVPSENDSPARTEPAERLTRRVGVVSAAVFTSRILGLVREQTFAILFGAGRELDAFVTAFRIPNLLRDLLAEGALSAAFVTTFTQRFEREGDRSAWALASAVVTALALLVTFLCLLGIWFAPAITTAIAPGAPVSSLRGSGTLCQVGCVRALDDRPESPAARAFRPVRLLRRLTATRVESEPRR